MKTTWKVILRNWIGRHKFGLAILSGRISRSKEIVHPKNFPKEVNDFLCVSKHKGVYCCSVKSVGQIVHGKVKSLDANYEVTFSVEPAPPKPPEPLKEFQSGDGAHCGLGDLYPDKEAALVKALASGKPFDTGWYSSKKEIASARIFSGDGKTITVEVSVSDDFDTNGMGRKESPGSGIEEVRETIYKAWDEANDDQKYNRQYRGYSIMHWSTKIKDYVWVRGKMVEKVVKTMKKKYPRCMETYIVNASDFGADRPPGDNYMFWGWQSDPMIEEADGWLKSKPSQGDNPDKKLGIPKKTQEKFEDHANSFKITSLRIGDWEIKPWKDDYEES